jgi:hypothetical protein
MQTLEYYNFGVGGKVMEVFLKRLSDVIAWLGFIYSAIFWVAFLMVEIGVVSSEAVFNVAKFIYPPYPYVLYVTIGLYPCCAVINYLMVGSFRLLPWRKLD